MEILAPFPLRVGYPAPLYNDLITTTLRNMTADATLLRNMVARANATRHPPGACALGCTCIRPYDQAVTFSRGRECDEYGMWLWNERL